MGRTKQELIKVILDLKFIDVLRNSDFNFKSNPLCKSCISLYEFLTTNNNIEIILAENGIFITKDELQAFIKDCNTPLPYFSNTTTNKYKFHPKFDFQHIKNPHLFCFLDFENKELNNLEQETGYCFANTSDYMEKWYKISIKTKYCESVSIDELFEWKEVEEYKLPTNNILISAPYLTSWNKLQIKYNLPGLFSSLMNINCKNNIVLISKYDKINSKNKSTLNLDELYNEALEAIKHYEKTDLSIIVFNIEDFESFPVEKGKLIRCLHDRNIFTNYLHYDSKVEWDYFKFNNKEKRIKVNKESALTIKSLAEDSHFKSAINYLEGYREIITYIGKEPFCNFIEHKGNWADNKLIIQ